MSGAANIAFDLRARAVGSPDRPALVAPDLSLNFQKLWRIVDCFACRLSDHGIGQGARIGLETGDRIVAVSMMFAAALVGAEFVTVDPHLMRMPALRPTHFLRSPEVPGTPGLTFLVLDESWSPRSGAGSSDGGASWPGYAGPESPAWIVQSSGTTGSPKFMQLSQALVHRRVRAVMSEYEAERTKMATLFSCGSRPFLIRAAAALLSGCTIVDSLDIGFLQAEGVDLVCAAPRQLREWLGPRRIEPRIARLQCSGAKLDPVTVRHLLDSFEQVEDVYGSSETIKAHVNVSRLAKGAVTTFGEPAGSEIQILSKDGLLCAEGEVGTVRIRNPHLATGYFGNAEATARSFRDGWFYPGDLAKWGADGVLDVIGRENDVLNLGGQKVSLTEVDRLLASVAGVKLAVAFRHPGAGLQDSLAAILQLDSVAGADDIVARAQGTCGEVLGPDVAPREIMVVSALPLTADGVPRRAECQELFRQIAEESSKGTQGASAV